jgi:glycosyltransferase involved in cell wall biosynthesis
MNDFDVLMPVYHRENPRNFKLAIQSIIDNSLKPNNLIIVCDGPLTKSLYKVLDDFRNFTPLLVTHLEKNMGIVKALNHGLSLCKSKYVIRCDSDDINYVNRFEKLIDKLDAGIDVVGSLVREFDSSGPLEEQKSIPIFHNDILRYAKYRNPINHMSVGFNHSKVKKVGGYPAVYLKEDYALWALLIGDRCTFENINENLVHARAGDDMVGRRKGFKAAKSEIKLQLILYNAGISKWYEAISALLIRYLLLLLPKFILVNLYSNVLRKKNN